MAITFRILFDFGRKSLEKRGFLEQSQTQNLQDFAEWPIDSQFAFDNRDQNVDADRNPNLRLHGVRTRAVEGFDPQVLFDPFEEQFDLPTAFVQLRDAQRGKREVVRQEHQPTLLFDVVEADAAQRSGVRLGRLHARQHDGLIAPQTGRLVDVTSRAAGAVEIAFGSRHKECGTNRQSVQSHEVDVAAIHHVERARLDEQVIEDVDVVRFSVSYPHKTGDIAPQVQQRVQLYGPLVSTKSRPRKQTQTQVDGGRVQGIRGVFQRDRQRVLRVQLARPANQDLGEVGIDPPIVNAVGIGQRAPRNASPKARMIQLGSIRPQTGLDVPQALAVRQLSKGQT